MDRGAAYTWTERSDSYRETVLKRRRDDIRRQREQVEILQGILQERAHGTE